MTLKELLEKRAETVAEIKRMSALIAAENRDFTPEEQAAWDKANADFDAQTRQIEVQERAAELESRIAAASGAGGVVPGREDRSGDAAGDLPGGSQAPVSAEQRAVAMQAWCRFQLMGEVDQRQAEAAQACGLNLSARELAVPILRRQPRTAEEVRTALSAITGAAGGFTVPEGFVNELEVALLAYGGVRQVASVIRTASGADLPWPTVNDTGNTGERLGENTAVTEDTGVASAFGSTVLRAHKFSSKLILVPNELLTDSAFDMVQFLGSVIGERIGRKQNTDFTTAAGASPQGIVTGATLGKTTSGATAITFSEVIDLIHSVDPAYRALGCGFMFHDNVALYLRKLVDGNGVYLWQPSVQVGIPDRISGYPFTINQDMASAVTTGLKTMLFGQLSKYKIRDVQSVRIRRLTERYAEYDQEGFVGFLRSDGALLDAGTHPVKYMQQA